MKKSVVQKPIKHDKPAPAPKPVVVKEKPVSVPEACEHLIALLDKVAFNTAYEAQAKLDIAALRKALYKA